MFRKVISVLVIGLLVTTVGCRKEGPSDEEVLAEQVRKMFEETKCLENAALRASEQATKEIEEQALRAPSDNP